MKDFSNTEQKARLGSYNLPRFHDQTSSRADTAYTFKRFGKRALDISIVLVSIVFVAPIIAFCAVIIALDGGAPFFGHMRVGQNGREFRCWKIRSMVVDAQSRLAAHLEADPEARAEWEATRKLTNDPRITRFGQFLRKSSLDELPQLLNVLLGQMSIVGPRPVPRDELAMYGSSRQAYLAMRPGITGLWQVSGRNDVSYAERIAMDQAYQKSCSFKLDLVIIFKTFGAVLGRSGR